LSKGKSRGAAKKTPLLGEEDDIVSAFLNTLGDMPIANVSKQSGSTTIDFADDDEATIFANALKTKLGKLANLFRVQQKGTVVTIRITPAARAIVKTNPGQMLKFVPIKVVD
jgi:hypothetical protein